MKLPTRPITPYLRFSRSVLAATRAEYPELKVVEVQKIIGMKWRALPEEEKLQFEVEYSLEKVCFSTSRNAAVRWYYFSNGSF